MDLGALGVATALQVRMWAKLILASSRRLANVRQPPAQSPFAAEAQRIDRVGVAPFTLW
jgi:hypothetical protein